MRILSSLDSSVPKKLCPSLGVGRKSLLIVAFIGILQTLDIIYTRPAVRSLDKRSSILNKYLNPKSHTSAIVSLTSQYIFYIQYMFCVLFIYIYVKCEHKTMTLL